MHLPIQGLEEQHWLLEVVTVVALEVMLNIMGPFLLEQLLLELVALYLQLEPAKAVQDYASSMNMHKLINYKEISCQF
jgi:hypothetical protein